MSLWRQMVAMVSADCACAAAASFPLLSRLSSCGWLFGRSVLNAEVLGQIGQRFPNVYCVWAKNTAQSSPGNRTYFILALKIPWTLFIVIKPITPGLELIANLLLLIKKRDEQNDIRHGYLIEELYSSLSAGLGCWFFTPGKTCG